MRNLVVATGAALLLGGCDSPDDVAKRGAEDVISKQLRDPDSARFSSEFIIRSGPNKDGFVQVATCGLVNAKNSFGGYAGNARFVAVSSESENFGPAYPYIYQIEDSRNRRSVWSKDGKPTATIFESLYWNAYCVDANHPPMLTGGVD